MKLIFKSLVVASIALSGLTANAQKFHLGIKAGANVYKNTGTDIEEAYKAFPFAGAYIGASGEKASLSIEGIFTQTKMITGDNFNQTFDAYIQNGKAQITNAEFSFSELSVPVLLGIKFLPYTWIELGPQFTKIVDMRDKDEILVEISNVHKDSYISGVVGLKIDLPFHLHLTGRYVQGITNRNNSSADERWTTQHFQVGLGLGL